MFGNCLTGNKNDIYCHMRKKPDVDAIGNWLCTSFGESELIENSKICTKSLQGLLFSDSDGFKSYSDEFNNLPMKILTKQAQHRYELVCGIFIQHFNKLRESYKAVYLELKNYLKEKELKKIR